MKYATKEWFEQQFASGNEGTDKWGHQWRASQNYRIKLSISLIREIAERNDGLRILDIGCGLGDVANTVYELNMSSKVLGIDISKNAVQEARKKFENIKFNVLELPKVPVGKHDIILALECIYYLLEKERDEALNNISSALKSNGYFLFSSHLSDDPSYFSANGALEAIRNAGFKVIEVIYNYAKLYAFFEKYLINIITVVDISIAIRNKKYVPVTLRHRMVASITKIPIVAMFFFMLMKSAKFLSKKLLSLRFPFYICQKLSQCFEDSFKSHIIILAQKV